MFHHWIPCLVSVKQRDENGNIIRFKARLVATRIGISSETHLFEIVSNSTVAPSRPPRLAFLSNWQILQFPCSYLFNCSHFYIHGFPPFICVRSTECFVYSLQVRIVPLLLVMLWRLGHTTAWARLWRARDWKKWSLNGAKPWAKLVPNCTWLRLRLLLIIDFLKPLKFHYLSKIWFYKLNHYLYIRIRNVITLN